MEGAVEFSKTSAIPYSSPEGRDIGRSSRSRTRPPVSLSDPLFRPSDLDP